ncbi:hypothetical protein [Hymenobacter sp. BT18]|uniref:hypothetical protein n=1 Tax=Hymenobacter sp. BT18 TaxID=2835648 RepID=UPI001E460C2F|nr:hypothetical protein [Hymenobacter sp. BT18]
MATIPSHTSTTWTGAVSSDWFTAANWSDGVPTATLDATIPGSAPRMPTVTVGTATAKALTINGGATLTLAGGMLDAKGDVSNEGTLTASAGTVRLSGGATQALGGTGSTMLYDLTVGSAGASLGGPVQVQRVLTLNGNLNSGGKLMLLSTPSLSSMVVDAGGKVQGTLAVQRAVAGATAGYRHFSPPVQGATVAQLGTGGSPVTVNSDYNSAPDPGKVKPFPTIFAYDEDRLNNATTASFSGGWVSPGATSDVLTPGQGVTVQTAGSQTVTFTGTAVAAPVTMSGLGNAGLADAGWHLLGNPFLAPLNLADMRTGLQTGGLADAVYVFRPSGTYTGSFDQFVNNVGTGDLADGQLAVGQVFSCATSRRRAPPRSRSRLPCRPRAMPIPFSADPPLMYDPASTCKWPAAVPPMW